jgi:uncharacterized cupin superfamily protein
VERGTSSLTLSSLGRIADALEVPVDRLFAPPPPSSSVSRQGEREPFRLEFSPVTYYRLGTRSGEGNVHPLLIELPPSTRPSPEAFRHPGEEFTYVLSGRLWLMLRGDEYELGPGDSMQFTGEQVHNWANRGKVVMRAIWVTTEAVFGPHR